MKITKEPSLIDCMALVRTDHKAKRTQLFCLKHGTLVWDTEQEMKNAWMSEVLRPIWRARSCRDQD